jgi:hypothetical protein
MGLGLKIRDNGKDVNRGNSIDKAKLIVLKER